MIRAAAPADAPLARYLAGLTPALGAQAEVAWALKAENPALPHRFYLATAGGGEAALLEQTGAALRVCGAVDDPEELAGFAAFSGVQSILGALPPLPGWRAAPLCLMRWAGTPAQDLTSLSNADHTGRPFAIDEGPAAREVAALLFAAGLLATPAQQDAFYSQLCTRLNHGYAAVLAARQNGAVVATAAAWAVTGSEAYLSAIATHPAHRGQGLAPALVAALCRRYANRAATLLCAPALAPFYRRLGFDLPVDAPPLSIAHPITSSPEKEPPYDTAVF